MRSSSNHALNHMRHSSNHALVVFMTIMVLLVNTLAAPLPMHAAGVSNMYVVNLNTNNIIQANLDGTGGVSLGNLGTLNLPAGIALDVANGKMYVTNNGNNTISRANLDGTGGTSLGNLGGTLNTPYDIALDVANGKLYVANFGNNTITKANLDGTGGVSLGNLGGTLNFPVGIALDVANGKLYVTNFGNSTISQANLDGTSGSSLGNLGGTLNSPGSIALDGANGKLYVANFGNNTISRANLDGTGAVSLGNPGGTLSNPFGIALDVANGKMYVTNNGNSTISQANLDGTGGSSLGNLGGTLNVPFGIALDVPPDTTAPTVNSFTAPASSSSLNIPISAFTATDDVAVTGYLITTTSTPPTAGAAGWTGSAPTTHTVVSDGTYTLYPWAKDAAGNVSAVFGSPASVTVDTTAPTVTGFTVPASSSSLNIPISAFTATDAVGVTGYLITTSSTPPSAGAAGWTGAAPTTHTVVSDGTYTLYPWAKDAIGNVSAVFGSPASVTVDTTAPTVTAFSATSPTNSLNIPISVFTATDAVGVTGYLITTSSTPPSAGVAGWTGAAPTTYTVGSQGSYTLYPWAKDAVGNVSAVFGSPASVTVDTTAPTVTSFTAPASSSSLNIPISAFAATDNVGVTGYLITTSSTPPTAGAAGWTGVAPTTYTVASNGSYALYPWAKDAAGNVSAVFGSPASVTVVNVAPTVTAFSATSPTNSLNIPISAFTATDDVGVTGYLITTSSTPPSAGAAGWTGSAPTTYTVGSQGSYTLYPWAKDASGNVSAVFGSPASVTVDTTAPTVTSFTVPASSSSLNIPISAFTATDAVGVTGYLITTSSTPPSAGAAGWTGAAPTTYTVASNGSYTLYPWAKDASGNVSPVFGSPISVTVVPPKSDSFVIYLPLITN
jgi:DNA-binding beta-propeller fold protein YncE